LLKELHLATGNSAYVDMSPSNEQLDESRLVAASAARSVLFIDNFAGMLNMEQKHREAYLNIINRNVLIVASCRPASPGAMPLHFLVFYERDGLQVVRTCNGV